VYRICVVDGLQRIRCLSVLALLRPNRFHLPRSAGLLCRSQEATPVSIAFADAGRVFGWVVGFAQERGQSPAFDPMATVVAPL
jgi:hypothetical protein